MSQLSLATKIGLINSFANYPVSYITQNAPGSATNQTVSKDPAAAATADEILIAGFGQFNLKEFRYMRFIKPVAGVNHVISLDADDPAQITVAPNLVKGDMIVFKLEIKSDDARGEFASMDTRETRYQPPFTYICKGNDTAADVVAGLYQQLISVKTLFAEADGAGEPYTVTYDGTAKALTITAADCLLRLKLYIDDLSKDNAAQVPVFAPITVTEQFEGRGTFAFMRSIIHETEGSNAIDSHTRRTFLPDELALYSQIHFGTRTGRPDLSGAGAASQEIFQLPDFSLYVAERATNDATLDGIITFLNRASGTKEFIAGDVAGTPTNAAGEIAAAIPAPNPATDPQI